MDATVLEPHGATCVTVQYTLVQAILLPDSRGRREAAARSGPEAARNPRGPWRCSRRQRRGSLLRLEVLRAILTASDLPATTALQCTITTTATKPLLG